MTDQMDLICELCIQSVPDGCPQVRITSDTGTGDVFVLAIFHHGCVRGTMNRADFDEVDYINEARRTISRQKPETRAITTMEVLN